MANTHIGVNEATYYGRLLRTYVGQTEQGLNGIIALRDAMTLMINGDGTQDAHFTDMTAKFGWGTDTISHNAYNEIVAYLAKVTTDASVTLVKTQTAQIIAKFK